jgi:hypothetical protein
MGSLFKIIFLVIVLMKIGLLFFLPNPQLFENHSIALNFLQTGTMFYELDGNIDYNHQFPLYDSFLIGMYSLFGVQTKLVLIAHILINAFTVLLVIKLTKKILNSIVNAPHWISYATGLMILVHPYLTFHQLQSIHPLTFDVFFATASLYFSFRFFEKPTTKNALLFSVIFGLTLLERFTLVVTILPVFILVIQQYGFTRITVKKISFLFSIGVISFSLFLAPWMYRNYLHTNRFEMTSGTYRYLWVGSLSETEGTNNLINGDSYYELLPQQPTQWNQLSFEEQMNFYKTSYLKTLNDQPFHIAKMWGIKIKNFFWFSSVSGDSYKHNVYSWGIIVYKFSRFGLLIGAFLGLLFYWKYMKSWLSALVALAILQSFFYTESRHIMPLIFILYVLFFLSIHKITTRRRILSS